MFNLDILYLYYFHLVTIYKHTHNQRFIDTFIYKDIYVKLLLNKHYVSHIIFKIFFVKNVIIILTTLLTLEVKYEKIYNGNRSRNY